MTGLVRAGKSKQIGDVVWFGIASELGIPIRFIGVGEAAKDLRPFDAGAYINAILPLA